MPTEPAFTAIDLFCGCGGLSLGLGQAGFDVRLGLDFDAHALRTYEANLRHRVLHADVREVGGSQLLDLAGVEHLDLLAGGPSCQGFSTHGKRLEDDPRNFLYREFVRLVEEIRPETVLLENVKGMLISGRGRFAREVTERFEDLGYFIKGHLVLAADFGVPQRRERVFFLGSRGGEVTPPTPTHAERVEGTFAMPGLRPHVTVEDAIGDLPATGATSQTATVPYPGEPLSSYQREMRGAAQEIHNHVIKQPSEHALSIIRQVLPGAGLRSIPAAQLPARFQRMRTISNGSLRKDCTTLYGRLSSDKPSYTITCYFNNVSAGAFTHPSADRAITAREAARLQSFPDDFVFHGSYIPRQIGNAVPPLLARRVGESLLHHLNTARDWQERPTRAA